MIAVFHCVAHTSGVKQLSYDSCVSLCRAHFGGQAVIV